MTACLALAAWELGDLTTAQQMMEPMLAKVEIQGYVRLFLDCGPKMAELLRQMNASGISPVYTRRLLVAFSEDTRSGTSEKEQGSELTEREREVLLLIAAGHSNQEIADELVISMGTVKRHISNIYGKLGAGSRTKAVAAARELDLIG